MANKFGPQCLGRDRAYRRYWKLESCPGLFVEHDDDYVGECLENPTKIDLNAKPLDEELAIEKVKKILDEREKSSEAAVGNQSSDKENNHEDLSATNVVSKTYMKKSNTTPALTSKVLSPMNNGTIDKDSSDACTSDKVKKEEPIEAVIEPIKSETMEVNDVKSETETGPKMWGICLSDMDNCTVHSTILPKTHWSYIGNVEELNKFIEALNPRGVRESELKDKLTTERDAIVKHLKKFNADIERSLMLDNDEEVNMMVYLPIKKFGIDF